MNSAGETEREKLDREIASTTAYLDKLRRARRVLSYREYSERVEKSDRIEAIRKAYAANEVSIEVIATRFGVSRGNIQRMARIYDWPRRRPWRAACPTD